jgi:hypothetical protein
MDWQELLRDLQTLRNSMDNFQNPNPTSLNIVLEEISFEENHTL